jgi:outer membrane scaffolding protein for murein synthesis (MipA/OmpV family)
LLALAVLAFGAGVSHAEERAEDGLTVTLGAERSRSSLLGGGRNDKAETSPIFGVDFRSGRFFASTEQGVGYEFVKSDWLTGFAALGYQAGRKEGRAGNKKDNQRLVGMGQVSGSGLWVAGFNAAPLGELVELSVVLLKSTRSEQGLTAIVGAGIGLPVWGPVNAYVEAGAIYGDRKNNQTFFGVTAAQATRSGNPVFSPKAGFVGSKLSVGLEWEIDKQWSASASVGREQLMGEAKKSPLFLDRSDTTAALSVSYKF